MIVKDIYQFSQSIARPKKKKKILTIASLNRNMINLTIRNAYNLGGQAE